MTTPAPSLGRIVLYCAAGEQEYPAIITAVEQASATVNLQVFVDRFGVQVRRDVQHNSLRQPIVETWRWPPR